MSDRPQAAPRARASRGGLRRFGRSALRFAARLPIKLYALALILIIGWLSWRAFRYLAVTLILASPPPEQITALPRELREETLLSGRSAFAAIGAVEHPRSPLAHYHRSEGWVLPDRLNDCTRGGCHNPLPHAERKEVRAFLNLHATSIHCGVCHVTPDASPAEGPLATTWYDRETGRRGDPPALLRLYDLLVKAARDADETPPTRELQQRIVRLLRESSEEGGGLPALVRLADHFEAVRPQSEAFAELLRGARESVPGYFRGDYGTKLALAGGGGSPLLAHPGTEDAVERWLSAERGAMREHRRPAGSEAQRRQMLDAVHPRKRPAALHCTDCHSPENGLIDFDAMGYPAARVRKLRDPFLFQMIEHISAGRDMHMPGFIAPAPPAPATQPAP